MNIKIDGCKTLMLSILIAVSGILLPACIEHNIVGRDLYNELSFVPVVASETKAGFFTSDNLSSLGIFSFYTPTGDFTWANQSPNFMNNQLVSRVGLGPWVYTPKKYWPIATGGKLSFFAYAPHSSVLALTDGALTLDATTAVSPSLLVTMPSKQADQHDVLVSAPKLNKRISDVVNGSLPLSFSHVLSSIDFQAQTTSGTVQIFSVKVFYTNTVKRSGKVSLSTGSWLSGSLTGAYSSVDGTTDAKKDIILNTSTAIGSGVTNLTSSSSHLLLIPQTLSAGNIKVEIIYSQDGGASKTRTISLPAQTYVAGSTYPFLFIFSPTEVFPIPLPVIRPAHQSMCGCGYDRVTNPVHDMNLPHYSPSGTGGPSWILEANKNYTTGIQFKVNSNFYIYGNLTVSSWYGSTSIDTLYVMPGGSLNFSNVNQTAGNTHIQNFGTINFPTNFTVATGSSLTSATPINAPNTKFTVAGTLNLYANTNFKEVATNGTWRINVHKCLNIQSNLYLGGSGNLHIYSYVHAGALTMNSTAKLNLYTQTMIELDNDFLLYWNPSYRILNNDTGYAVFKCPKFSAGHPNINTSVYGNIDIHGIINTTWWNPSQIIWDSRIKFNGPTTIPADGCRPAFP